MSRQSFVVELWLMVPLFIWLAGRWEGWRSPLCVMTLLGLGDPLGTAAQAWSWGPTWLRFYAGDCGSIANTVMAVFLVLAVIQTRGLPCSRGLMWRIGQWVLPIAVGLVLFGAALAVQTLETTGRWLFLAVAAGLLGGWQGRPQTVLSQRRYSLLALAAAVSYGAGSELLQYWGGVPGQWDPYDLLAYGVGAGVAGMLLVANLRFVTRML